MTEQEWLRCTDPEKMLAFLLGRSARRGFLEWFGLARRRDQVAERWKASERKLRFYGCACCRRLWHLLSDPRSRRAIEFGEYVADGVYDETERQKAQQDAEEAMDSIRQQQFTALIGPSLKDTLSPILPSLLSAQAAGAALLGEVEECVRAASESVVAVAVGWKDPAWARDTLGPNVQEAILRDIFGNPWVTATVAPQCLAWNDRVVQRLAAVAYERRAEVGGGLDSDSLAILADALEDAGCSDAAILDHLRGPGPHVRGCWAVDLLLDKK